mmetsp:Transcript_1352/g.4677  ORF Transcript_1352/g.4677 Transcript_1352/m.4677 type:complete len:81 (+) Transcript_1352:1359-1601(+)
MTSISRRLLGDDISREGADGGTLHYDPQLGHNCDWISIFSLVHPGRYHASPTVASNKPKHVLSRVVPLPFNWGSNPTSAR